jgi:hypothetical protein
VLTVSRRAHKQSSGKVELIEKGLPGRIVSSGHGAVDVAMGLGFKRLVLVGFDCRVVDGRSHNHHEFNRPAVLFSDTFLPAWDPYPARARERSVEIINATPGSAIKVFKTAALAQVL